MTIDLTLYCIVDRVAIPHERAIKKSNTCGDACAKILKAKRRALVDQRRCRVCNKPSTPEERKAYQAFLRANPEFKKAKRGRPRNA